MAKIILEPKVKQYLKDLTYILFKKEYFSYLETSIAYVIRLTGDIEKHIGIKQHHLTPRSLRKYGKYYASFPVNKRTTWYVFFDKKDDRYYIEYITNNHVSKASVLKRLK